MPPVPKLSSSSLSPPKGILALLVRRKPLGLLVVGKRSSSSSSSRGVVVAAAARAIAVVRLRRLARVLKIVSKVVGRITRPRVGVWRVAARRRVSRL